MTLKTITDVDIKTIIERHVERVTQNHLVLANPEDVDVLGEWEPKYTMIAGKPTPRKAALIPKYLLLLHLIIERCSSNDENMAYFPTKHYIPIFGRQFMEMLYTLEEMKIISIGYFQLGKNSRPISLLKWAVEELSTTNKKVAQMAKEEEIMRKKRRPKYIAYDKFSKNYNASLKLIKLVRKDDAIKFINDNFERNTFRYHHYLNKIVNFEKRIRITSVDKNGRIYHYITNFPRVMKKYLNLRYQLDVHNSHPLIVNHYLMKYYNISSNIIFKILNNINYKIDINNHKDCNNLCKELKNNVLWKEEVKSIPSDVLLYIYTTSKGVFWDIMSDMTKVERDDVKGKFFQEIFYGYNKNTRGKEFGKKFVELYPHVWKVLRILKKQDEGLPNTMMQHEAHMMKEILCRMYDCGLKVASIHDAVIVVDDDANDEFDVVAGVNLMVDVYRKYGLYPSIDVKDYKESLQ